MLLILEGSFRVTRALQEFAKQDKTLIGDMPIRDVFFQVDEGALENDAWETIGKDIRDKLSFMTEAKARLIRSRVSRL